MKSWYFTFDDIRGHAEAYSDGAYPAGIFVSWGGMGFHIDAACQELREAVLIAKVKAEERNKAAIREAYKNRPDEFLLRHYGC